MGIRGMGGERLDSLAQDVGVPYNIYIYIYTFNSFGEGYAGYQKHTLLWAYSPCLSMSCWNTLLIDQSPRHPSYPGGLTNATQNGREDVETPLEGV